jgi:hypothetical protein
LKLGRLALLTLALAPACDPGSSDSGEPVSNLDPEPVEWQPAAGSLMRYVSTWDWSGAQRADTGEWIFETDLGTRVGIDLGYLTTSTMMLVPCTEAETGEDQSTDFRSHSTISDDSLLTGPWIEAFAEHPEDLQYGFATASGERYCSLHWLAATSEELGASIEIRGWFEQEHDERVPFTATVPLANGGLRPLHFAATDDTSELPRSSGTVRLTRHPARALDGVDIEALTPSELAFEFLQGLARTSDVSIEP